jgi:hypothetical protein
MVLEEAVELALASAVAPLTIMRVVVAVLEKAYSEGPETRPQGEAMASEAADVLSTLYALASDRQFDVHVALDHKMALNRHRPQGYYDAKTAQKREAGII